MRKKTTKLTTTTQPTVEGLPILGPQAIDTARRIAKAALGEDNQHVIALSKTLATEVRDGK
jgi:hypothetical protein